MLLFDYKIPVEADRALRDAYVALAFAFRRLEGSARSRDTELCSTLLKVRAEIERVLKAQDAAPAEALAAPSASQEALREALEALEPFAKEADEWADTVPDDHRSLCTEPGVRFAYPGSETVFTVGDLRRAKSALTKLDAALAQSAHVKGGE